MIHNCLIDSPKYSNGNMESAPTWADQWDNNNPDPTSAKDDDKKVGNKSAIKKLQEKVLKIFGKKSQPN